MLNKPDELEVYLKQEELSLKERNCYHINDFERDMFRKGWNACLEQLKSTKSIVTK